MQDAEIKWFEAELDGNPWLRNELLLRQKTDEILKNSDALTFRQKLIEAEAQHKKSNPTFRSITSRISQFAAIFIGVVIIGSSIMLLNRTPDYNKKAEKHISVFYPANTRSIGTEYEGIYSKAHKLFETGNYAEVITLLSDIVYEEPELNMMLGSSNMKVGYYSRAAVSFNSVIEDNDNLFLEEAKWLISLCYMNIEEEEKAKPILEGIINSESKYKKDARKILRKIK